MGSAKKNLQSLPAFVALMRGINVGGKNMLPMKDLVLLFVEFLRQQLGAGAAALKRLRGGA